VDLSFQRLRLPDGHSYAIEGSLIGLDNKSVDRKGDGRLVAKPSHQNDRLTYVGYGAGAGLIAGLLTKRPLEDTLFGGGLGYLFGALQKGRSDARDVVLTPGTEMGVRLDNQITVTNYQDDNPNHSTRYHQSIGREDYESPGIDIGVLVGDRDVRFSSTALPIMTKDGRLLRCFRCLLLRTFPITIVQIEVRLL